MKAKKRLDYTPPLFTISTVKLELSLSPERTEVKSELRVQRNGQHNKALALDGEGLEFAGLMVDGKAHTHYSLNDSGLIVSEIPDEFTLQVKNTINPKANTALEGLYLADKAYCTQCEAEGFRRITYFLDRPDILARYTVTIHADADAYPYLLSNGNKLSDTVDSGTRTVVWEDPFPKPCYLFALVAGDFDVLSDTYQTQSGREVALALFVDKGQLDKADFAMASLKRAMKWDEETFDLEYDLDIYMIVAVDFFNMGAMENKGLNVFNSKFILANDQTATDSDYFNIESVVAHEYFHNWTGNRVTCRDWFQLSLKEGLTVFRDQLFSADMTSELSTRIAQVKIIKEHQFPEDASAMSHPIRPDEVIEMNNFYTVTVYDKGAEIIRMLWNIVGPQAFKDGLKHYFHLHDGKAVTCDDFVDAIQSATSIDLSHFRHWYSQSGTPRLTVVRNTETHTYELKQTTPNTADQADKRPLSLLFKFQCYDERGIPLSIKPDSEHLKQLSDNTLLLEGESATLAYASSADSEAASKPRLTLLGDFSSPIIVEQDISSKALSEIAQYDANAFTRWDAIQQILNREVEQFYKGETKLSHIVLDTLTTVVKEIAQNEEVSAEFLSFPSLENLIYSRTEVEVHKLSRAMQTCYGEIARSLYDQLFAAFECIPVEAYSYNSKQVVRRRLKSALVKLMSYDRRSLNTIESLYRRADNMTDTLSALGAAQNCESVLFGHLMQDFEQKWQRDGLVMDKWFALHATHTRDDILSQLALLQEHPRFDANNPNRVRSLIGSFAFYNKTGFHKSDGSGYKFLTDYLLKLDKVNPQVAARIVTPLTQYQSLCASHQQGMKAQLSRLLNQKGLSKDVFEKVSKALAYESEA
jgi:aminopeptidase N